MSSGWVQVSLFGVQVETTLFGVQVAVQVSLWGSGWVRSTFRFLGSGWVQVGFARKAVGVQVGFRFGVWGSGWVQVGSGLSLWGSGQPPEGSGWFQVWLFAGFRLGSEKQKTGWA